MGIPDNSINLGRRGKYGTIDFNSLKGGIKKSDIESSKQIKLFNKLDLDKNGVLSDDEIAKLKENIEVYTDHGKITRREGRKFLKQEGLKGELKGKEALQFLNQLGLASENISKTFETVTKGGIELLNIEYNQAEDGSVITETLVKETGAKYSQKTVNGDKSVTQLFDADGKVAQEITEENGVTTTVKYDSDGNVISTTRKKGAVTEFLNSDGKVIQKVTDKGSGLQEVTDYVYDTDGNLAKQITTGADGKEITTEFDKDGNVIKSTTINSDGSQVIDDGKTITTINKDGTKTVENKETGAVQSFDKDGNPIKEKTEPYKHTVQVGDTWYGIVQAKYGITDHQQTMEIVRQLKAHNGVDPKATNMPKEIELPDTVTLKDGTEVQLANKDAEVDKSHNNITNSEHSYNVAQREAQKLAEKQAEEVQLRDSSVTEQKEILEKAKADFEAQLKSDGWAGKTADAISVLWGSENREVKVREDIETYENQLKELEAAKSQGEEQFKAKFKEIFGVDYNSDNIKSYLDSPTAENYAKAYGTENDIARRVAEYNESQQKGAKAIKTTVVVAGSVAAGIATGGASLAATAAVAGVTTAGLRVATEVTDLATNDIDGDVAENAGDIAKQAAIEGAISAVTAGTVKGVGGIVGKSGQAVTETGLSVVDDAGGAVANAAANSADDAANAGLAVAKNTTNAADDFANAAGKAGANSTAEATKATIRNIANKVGSRGGFKSLNQEELSQLAKILDVDASQVANLSKTQIKSLLVKFHPDKCKLEYANELTTILTNMLKEAV